MLFQLRTWSKETDTVFIGWVIQRFEGKYCLHLQISPSVCFEESRRVELTQVCV